MIDNLSDKLEILLHLELGSKQFHMALTILLSVSNQYLSRFLNIPEI